jgi:Bacterial membrane protein YfhO
MVGRARSAPSIGASLSEMAHRPFDPRHEVILANDTPPELAARFSDGVGVVDASARIVEYSPHRVRVAASTRDDALLVLTDTYYPGWQAFVDGQPQPLVRGDLLFRVVPVPAGEHTVELRFEPTSVRIGLLVSLLAVLVAVTALLVAGATRFAGRTT